MIIPECLDNRVIDYKGYETEQLKSIFIESNSYVHQLKCNLNEGKQ